MPILVPVFCCLIVGKGVVKYYNASKACDNSRKLYHKGKEQMNQNLQYKKRRNKKMRRLLEEIDSYGASL